RGHPGEVALLLSVELCSLTLQRDDLSIPNLIATGLFGDGAAAVVLTGAERGGAGPAIVATRSAFYPGTEEVMGWRVGGSGFQVVLSAAVPEMARKYLRGDVDAFLLEHSLGYDDIAVWVAHPGGPKVMVAVEWAYPMMPPAVSWLGRMGVEFAPACAHPFRGIRYVDGEVVAEADFVEGPGLGIRRTALSSAMRLRAAALGAELRQGCEAGAFAVHADH